MNGILGGAILQAEHALKQGEPYLDTLVGNLTRRKNRAQVELDNVNAALEALAKNPEVAEVLELITKAGR